jgi:hypothetical protein
MELFDPPIVMEVSNHPDFINPERRLIKGVSDPWNGSFHYVAYFPHIMNLEQLERYTKSAGSNLMTKDWRYARKIKDPVTYDIF